MDIAIRQARPDELNVAADYWNNIVSEAFGENWDRKYPNWRSIFLAAMQRKIVQGLQRYYVAEVGGEVVGVAGAQAGEAFFGAVRGYVEGVYIVPPFRRKGVATLLMRACIEWLKSMGCDVVRLQATLEGRPLYESLGFVPTGEMELALNPTKQSFEDTYGDKGPKRRSIV
ncbi:MAG: GNAT family N-acetyltransferase [Candidatus Eremiobacteraeota bacterium]|nr:GNAT family N-acetyltransferase [Candidatus Eremiobacteraeota bacterium]